LQRGHLTMSKSNAVEYDPKADILTINLVDAPHVIRDELLDNDIVLGYDEKERLVQIQILDASKR